MNGKIAGKVYHDAFVRDTAAKMRKVRESLDYVRKCLAAAPTQSEAVKQLDIARSMVYYDVFPLIDLTGRATDLDAILTAALNRRAKIEQELLDMAAGKVPMPTADQLRDIALRLGTPTSPAEPPKPSPESPERA